MWVIAAACVAPFAFRRAGVLLALCPAGLAVLRLVPGPLGRLWANRSRWADALTMGAAAIALGLLALLVPSI
ncbi:hypothetical protein GSY69_08575 [Brevibacterium sp. 5221]|uniref:DUF3017 domain-containing protein n=1 Tax=Brevibacterium rongguiense TaxID=2695267 RepID=A0A6N9H883_9MICO|nr:MULTISPECIES: hypothetical protein [Brevibacterium]MYM20016.1 hypothetical protein [Brevibacterium rongguiense]WAL40270.1 hypothetical protein BRM1_13780 [Brevibacterium sp. BRM-1]